MPLRHQLKQVIKQGGVKGLEAWNSVLPARKALEWLEVHGLIYYQASVAQLSLSADQL